ncbi:MAG: hypothetical protein KKF89_00610, partial [Nanoarchaeota archaeon]|nr:hypothetical protein [Nanoarchaeota archaeon]
NNKNIKCIILTFIILISIIHVDSSFGYKGHNFLTLKNIINNYKSAFYSEINNLIKNQTDENPLILTTSEQFPLMFYTDYAVQIVWPVRKSFIDNSDEELFIIETGAVEGTCNFFYQYVDSNSRCNANKNYLERIKDCENMVVDASTTIYYCKERTKFIGGGLGLFFPDFPSGYPPDFIWDQVPFPVAINVNNLGEYDVNKLKVVFNGNFNSREFDAEKQEFVFEDVLHGQHKVLGEVISSKKLFELGNLTFNHKLASKSRIVNASVKICYSYTTMIMVKICDDSKAICGLDVSGAPIQLENISYNQLGFNFSIKNSAEGSLGSFQFCSAEKIEEVKVFSDYFKCTEFNELFSCLGQNIFEGNTYLVNISYDYQQEFDKSILLRSKELNKYDYENFYKEE